MLARYLIIGDITFPYKYSEVCIVHQYKWNSVMNLVIIKQTTNYVLLTLRVCFVHYSYIAR